MKCLVWNCRGCSRPEFVAQFKFMSSLINLDVFCVLETRSGLGKLSKNVFCKWFNSMFCAEGKLVGLACSGMTKLLLLM